MRSISSKPTSDCVDSAMQARRFFTSFRMTAHSINTSSRART